MDPAHAPSDDPTATPSPATSAPQTPPWLSARLWIPILAILAGLLSLSGTLDSRAQASADRVFQQALLTFAAARTLDAAVSLAEGTEVALQPAGVGVTVSAGEILEPIDHMVEQFSSVMLISTTSLGVQSLMLRASAWRVMTALLMLFLVLRLVTVFSPGLMHPAVQRVVVIGTSLLLIGRFAMPLYSLGTSMLFERYLQPSQIEAVAALGETSGDVREIEQLAAPEPDAGLIGRVSSWFTNAVERLDVSERIEAFRDRVSDAVEHLLNLLVIFFLQTVLLPIGFLWMLPKVARVMMTRR